MNAPSHFVSVLLLLALFLTGCTGSRPSGQATGDSDVPAGKGVHDILSGEVFYRPRIALPPGAVVYVRLDDVSRADAPATTLAEQTIPTEGHQVPLPFSLRYDAAQVEPRHRYAIRAEIRGPGGALLWTTDAVHPVLTQGAPTSDVRIEVVQVAVQEQEEDDSAGRSLVGLTWQLVQVKTGAGETLTPPTDTSYTIAFRDDGHFGGSADCNRYGGRYEAAADGGLTLTGVAATLAACPPPSQADAFMNVLNAVDSYAVQLGRLRLTAGQGGVLTFEGASEAGTMAPQPTGETFVFECAAPSEGEAFSFTARTGPGELAVWLPGRFAEEGTQERYLVLGQVRAASGARYEGDGVVVWTRGADEALLEVGGQTFTRCTSNPQRAAWEEARRHGVDFRAVGQEPGWHLEIREGERIRFVYAYGEREAVVPAPEPIQADGRTVYRAQTEAHDLTATITDEPCTDAMSGERFPATVTVTLDGQTYRGCGRPLS